jgi:hypothetical protein
VVRSHPDSREAMLQLAKVNDFLEANYKVSEQWNLARPLYDRANNAACGLFLPPFSLDYAMQHL